VNFLALRSFALFLSNGESSRHPYKGGCMLKNSNDMATLTITRPVLRAFSLKEWMNVKSNFYTHICEFPVTRLLAIRINLLSLCLILAALAIEQQPITSVVATICAGYLVYRINKSEKKGGKK
jgi:Na+/H+ antiporter